jgi:hypothetical protein
MAWLRDLPAGELKVYKGGGSYETCNKPILASSHVLIDLAGLAWERLHGIRLSDDNTEGSDICSACTVIESCPELQNGPQAECATSHVIDDVDILIPWIEYAMLLLKPFLELIDRIGDALAARGRLSARSVAALIREYHKRQVPEENRFCAFAA